MTAPACRRRSTSAAFFVAGRKASAAMPMEESMPVIWKLSFTDMGRPWRGPRGLPVRARCESSSEARATAAEKRGSARQFVNWWAIAARF